MRTIAVLILATLAPIGACLAESPSDETANITWHSQYAHAYSEMKTQNRPMLVFIKSDACMFCKKMDRSYQDPTVAEEVVKSFVPAVVNSSTNPELARQFRAKVFPTTVIVSSDGRVVDTIPGYLTAAKLQTRLQQAQTKLR